MSYRFKPTNYISFKFVPIVGPKDIPNKIVKSEFNNYLYLLYSIFSANCKSFKILILFLKRLRTGGKDT